MRDIQLRTTQGSWRNEMPLVLIPLSSLVKSCGFIDQRNDALWSHITDDEKRQELLKCPLVIQPNGVVLTSLILQIFCWARVLCWAISGFPLRITIPVISSYCQKNVLLYIVFSNLLELPFDLICKSDKKCIFEIFLPTGSCSEFK